MKVGQFVFFVGCKWLIWNLKINLVRKVCPRKRVCYCGASARRHATMRWRSETFPRAGMMDWLCEYLQFVEIMQERIKIEAKKKKKKRKRKRKPTELRFGRFDICANNRLFLLPFVSCALLDIHRPDLIDYDELDKNDHKGNMALAFRLASEEIGIPALLDVEDVCDVNRPDEKSLMTYIAYWFHAFSHLDRIENAGRRVEKFVEHMQGAWDMQHAYEERMTKVYNRIHTRFCIPPPHDNKNANASKKNYSCLRKSGICEHRGRRRLLRVLTPMPKRRQRTLHSIRGLQNVFGLLRKLNLSLSSGISKQSLRPIVSRITILLST